MKIRKEKEEDFKQIYDVIKIAFSLAEHSDGNEQDLVNNLRKSEAYINELSLVCEEEGEIVAYIMFTKNKIGKEKGLSLAPLAVLPKYQHRRLGTLLIKQGLKIAKELGYNYVVVLGSEKYYPKFGFSPSKDLGINSPFKVPSKNFMALSLHHNKEKLNATVEYPKEFFKSDRSHVVL